MSTQSDGNAFMGCPIKLFICSFSLDHIFTSPAASPTRSNGGSLWWLGRYCFCIYFYNCFLGSLASHWLCVGGGGGHTLGPHTEFSSSPLGATGVLLVEPHSEVRWKGTVTVPAIPSLAMAHMASIASFLLPPFSCRFLCVTMEKNRKTTRYTKWSKLCVYANVCACMQVYTFTFTVGLFFI